MPAVELGCFRVGSHRLNKELKPLEIAVPVPGKLTAIDSLSFAEINWINCWSWTTE
jgi:hypothetical protein